jgi:hypothetical protein
LVFRNARSSGTLQESQRKIEKKNLDQRLRQAFESKWKIQIEAPPEAGVDLSHPQILVVGQFEN